MNFVWNREKSKSNLHKHGISFDTAIYVFTDPDRVEIYDQKHSSENEDRYITIGYVENVPLFVVYTMAGEDCYRIISARKALKLEIEKYCSA